MTSSRRNEVPFINASQIVFGGVRLLLDDQTPEARRPAAVVRLRAYAGLEPGYTAITEILKQRTQEQMAKPGVIYPAKVEIETEMARNSNYVEGTRRAADRSRSSKAGRSRWPSSSSSSPTTTRGCAPPCCPRRATISACRPSTTRSTWRTTASTFRPRSSPQMAHDSFIEIQGEMKSIAAQDCERPQAAVERLSRRHPRAEEAATGRRRDSAVLREPPEADREESSREHQIVTLPDRPARIRIATAAETAQQPAPHMVPPPFIHNTGQKGEFVLPLNIPARTGTESRLNDTTTSPSTRRRGR